MSRQFTEEKGTRPYIYTLKTCEMQTFSKWQQRGFTLSNVAKDMEKC